MQNKKFRAYFTVSTKAFNNAVVDYVSEVEYDCNLEYMFYLLKRNAQCDAVNSSMEISVFTDANISTIEQFLEQQTFYACYYLDNSLVMPELSFYVVQHILKYYTTDKTISIVNA